VVRAVGQEQAGATVAHLSQITGLDRAVLYRLLATLEDQDFVVRDAQTRRFRLGTALVELGQVAALQEGSV
jgi:DNA-binding IclR family transcriptional regulator